LIRIITDSKSTEAIKLLLLETLQASSFGGSNIDPTAWEDKKCEGESRFPAQVGLWFMVLSHF
jgi:hypothetical protein